MLARIEEIRHSETSENNQAYSEYKQQSDVVTLEYDEIIKQLQKERQKQQNQLLEQYRERAKGIKRKWRETFSELLQHARYHKLVFSYVFAPARSFVRYVFADTVLPPLGVPPTYDELLQMARTHFRDAFFTREFGRNLWGPEPRVGQYMGPEPNLVSDPLYKLPCWSIARDTTECTFADMDETLLLQKPEQVCALQQDAPSFSKQTYLFVVEEKEEQQEGDAQLSWLFEQPDHTPRSLFFYFVKYDQSLAHQIPFMTMDCSDRSNRSNRSNRFWFGKTQVLCEWMDFLFADEPLFPGKVVESFESLPVKFALDKNAMDEYRFGHGEESLPASPRYIPSHF